MGLFTGWLLAGFHLEIRRIKESPSYYDIDPLPGGSAQIYRNDGVEKNRYSAVCQSPSLLIAFVGCVAEIGCRSGDDDP